MALFNSLDIKGTFFFLGRIGRDLPHLLRETADAGHEIACHSDEHLRVYGMGQDEFRTSLNLAKKSLEDASGKGVYGFRAPDFSITRSNLWALDILKEAGFLYDSSIYPIGVHDVYGVGDAKCFIHTLPNGLVEYPLATFEAFGKRLPFGGGGYFRLYPVVLTKLLIKRMNNQGQPCMMYIHPYEVGTDVPVISEISYYRKFRHYYNCNNGGKRLKRILKSFRFCTAIDILKENNFLS